MRTLNFSILFVYLNFNKFPSSDFRVHWNARNSEKRTRKFRLPSSVERGISCIHLHGVLKTSMHKRRQSATATSLHLAVTPACNRSLHLVCMYVCMYRSGKGPAYTGPLYA